MGEVFINGILEIHLLFSPYLCVSLRRLQNVFGSYGKQQDITYLTLRKLKSKRRVVSYCD